MPHTFTSACVSFPELSDEVALLEPIQPNWLPVRSELPSRRWLASFAAISLLLHSLILVLLSGVVVVEQEPSPLAIDTRASSLAPDLRVYSNAGSGDDDGGLFLVDARNAAVVTQQTAPNGPQKTSGEFQVRGFLRVDSLPHFSINASYHSPDADYVIYDTDANLEPYAGREVILTCKSSSWSLEINGRTLWILRVAAVASAAPTPADTFEMSGDLRLLMGPGPAWQLVATHGQNRMLHRIQPALGVDLWPFSYRKVRLTVSREPDSPEVLIVHRIAPEK